MSLSVGGMEILSRGSTPGCIYAFAYMANPLGAPGLMVFRRAAERAASRRKGAQASFRSEAALSLCDAGRAVSAQHNSFGVGADKGGERLGAYKGRPLGLSLYATRRRAYLALRSIRAQHNSLTLQFTPSHGWPRARDPPRPRRPGVERPRTKFVLGLSVTP